MSAPIIFAIKLSVVFNHWTCYATASFLCIHRSLSERLPCGFIKSSAIVNNLKFMRIHTHHMCHASGVKLFSVHPTEARLVCRRTCELWCKRRTKKKFACCYKTWFWLHISCVRRTHQCTWERVLYTPTKTHTHTRVRVLDKRSAKHLQRGKRADLSDFNSDLRRKRASRLGAIVNKNFVACKNNSCTHIHTGTLHPHSNLARNTPYIAKV